MKIFKLLFLIPLILNVSFLYGQHQELELELSKLELNNENFKIILNSIIKHEKKCVYYTPNLIFTVNIMRSKNKISIIVESIDDKNIALDLKPCGFFYQEGHLFLIKGNMVNCFFSKTEIKTEFKYMEYDIYYEEYNEEGLRILRIILDDSFSQWEFSFSKGDFLLENKSTYCE